MTSIARWKRLLVSVLATGFCLWLAYAVVTTGVAAFFENEGDGAKAILWRPTSPAALALDAEALARQGKTQAANDLARRAIKRSSLRADALRVLAFSAAAADRNDEAESLLNRAARLNPRDGEVQGWLFQRALAKADYRSALRHADTMMRRSPPARVALAFTLTGLLGNDRARTAIVERLALDPPWRGAFLSVAVRQGEYADIAALFVALRPTPSPATDAEAGPFFQRLVAEGRFPEARADFGALINRTGNKKELVYDGSFSGRAGPAPLNWQAIPGLGGSARWKRDDGASLGALLVSHDGFSSSGPLVRQLIFLLPGAYDVAARSRIEDPMAAGRFTLQIVCASGTKIASMILPGEPEAWLSSHVGFAVPPGACDAQWLQIVPVTGDRREAVEMSIDDIVVKPASVPLPPPPVDAPT